MHNDSLPNDLIQNRFNAQVFNAFSGSSNQTSGKEGISLTDLYQLGIVPNKRN